MVHSALQRRARGAAVGLALPAVIALAGAAPAAGATLACGAEVATDTVLDADVTGCTGDGIRVVANGVTLDLRGHTISGAAGAGGVRVAQHKDVRIRNGTITGFDGGVVLDTSFAVRVTQMTLDRNRHGIQLANTADSRIDHNTVFRSGGDGIRVNGPGSDENTVEHNRVEGSVFALTVADGAGGNVLRQNRIFGNEFGILVFGDAPGTVIEHTVAQRNQNDGINVREAPGARIADNVASHNGDLGIEAFGVVDGGHNVARSNGNPLQCVGVAC